MDIPPIIPKNGGQSSAVPPKLADVSRQITPPSPLTTLPKMPDSMPKLPLMQDKPTDNPPPLPPKSVKKSIIHPRIFKIARNFLVGGICLLLVLFFWFEATRKDTVEDFTILCTGLFEDLPVNGKPTIKPSDAEIQARIQQAVENLSLMALHERKLAPISNKFSHLIQQGEDLQGNAPKLSPIVFGSVEAALGIYSGQRGIVGEGGKKALNGTENLWNAYNSMVQLYNDKQVLAIQLADLAPQFSGEVTNAELLACSFAEHKPGSFEVQTIDSLALTNSSDQELHNCVISVRLSNSAGDSYLNLYFVPDWKANEIRIVKYSDFDFPKDTVNGITQAEVILLSKEWSAQPVLINKPDDGWPDLLTKN